MYYMFALLQRNIPPAVAKWDVPGNVARHTLTSKTAVSIWPYPIEKNLANTYTDTYIVLDNKVEGNYRVDIKSSCTQCT
jgi:hypothetical protein